MVFRSTVDSWVYILAISGQQRSILVSPKKRAAFIAAIGHQPADVLAETATQQFSH